MKKSKYRGVRTPEVNRSNERRFQEDIERMIVLMSSIYRKQVLESLHVSTVEKFQDEAQVGNYAAAYSKIDKKVRRKLRKRFSNKRLDKMVREHLYRTNVHNQRMLYEGLEKAIGISTKQMIIKEGLQSTINALAIETTAWMTRLRDETLELYTNNTLRNMTLGNSLEDVMSAFDGLTEKRKNHAKFTARNQINNFNSIMTKKRAEKLGITRAEWITAGDERVRPSHEDRDGKTFDLKEGLYSSLDGKKLLPAIDYQCRCTYSLVIDDDVV